MVSPVCSLSGEMGELVYMAAPGWQEEDAAPPFDPQYPRIMAGRGEEQAT